MATLTAPVWLLAVLGVLVLLGALGVCWGCAGVAAGWAERAADWLRRDRVTPLLGDDEYYEDEIEELPPLPPERTWEQMTSHQLPLTEAEFVADLEAQGWFRPDVQAALREEARERRAPWWEAEHRAAYVAMGFDYPSGLMARVRELTP